MGKCNFAIKGEDEVLKLENTVLTIIDVQGKLATLMYQKEEFFANVIRMIRGAMALKVPILWNEQLPDKLGPTIPEIRELLPDMEPFNKSTFSCCGIDSYVDQLKSLDRKQILLVGMETHVCVYQTACDLIRMGYEVYLVADAVSSRTSENKQLGIEALKQVGARITSVEMALFEMMQVAEGDAFRQIVKIVK